jgi:transposase InsO family protein
LTGFLLGKGGLPMPFQETCVEDEKLRFIAECLRGETTMSERCEAFGISREWGYELLRRYRRDGPSGLEARSRAPRRCGHALPEGVALAIVALRRERPYWGPKKLRAVLAQRHREVRWPAASTIGDLLRREGLSEPRRRRRRPHPLTQPFAPVCRPNDLWCIDFKGWFRTADGRRCDPLTISDAESRFLIDCRIVAPTAEGVRPVVDAALHEHGLPLAIRSDNGPPFASTGAGGLTALAIHWIKLGIRLERILPGQPQQNGRHERMHGTLKRETLRPPAGDPAAQQARFERFRHDFNANRPHEALGQKTPGSRYKPFLPRPYPAKLEEPCYDADHAVRRVRSNGEIKWGGDLIYIGEALTGEPVGIAESDAGDWLVRFADVPLGIIDRKTRKLRRYTAARPGGGVAEQTQKTVSDVSGL